tara:strand:- start:445 stop:1260 length:816 start_codon:yes stop_codon:yes gene_type:complete
MEDLKGLQYCQTEYHDSWLTIFLNNKNKKNALSSKLIDEMINLLNNAHNNSKVRGIIIRGKNNIFCSGADLDELHQIAYKKENVKKLTIDMSMNIGRLLKAINEAPQITVSVVDGPCIAGGFGMACAADILVTMNSSIFRLSETKLGLTPSQIAPYILSRMNFSKARMLMLLGDTIDGEKAYEMEIADYLARSVIELNTIIDKIKSKVYLCSPNAISKTKNNLSLEHYIDIQKASELFYDCINHNEGEEGLKSYFEKRNPFWNIEKKEQDH